MIFLFCFEFAICKYLFFGMSEAISFFLTFDSLIISLIWNIFIIQSLWWRTIGCLSFWSQTRILFDEWKISYNLFVARCSLFKYRMNIISILRCPEICLFFCCSKCCLFFRSCWTISYFWKLRTIFFDVIQSNDWCYITDICLSMISDLRCEEQ